MGKRKREKGKGKREKGKGKRMNKNFKNGEMKGKIKNENEKKFLIPFPLCTFSQLQ